MVEHDLTLYNTAPENINIEYIVLFTSLYLHSNVMNISLDFKIQHELSITSNSVQLFKTSVNFSVSNQTIGIIKIGKILSKNK